ncbi:MAG: sigma-70 family RNA polymerase sigma factor [Bacteroidaceae bacterium]|nr:sigma-70 family RNA polymerase sigma factor [Bacteroidaceae bacterium]
MTDEKTINRVLADFDRRYSENAKAYLTAQFSVLSENEVEDIMQEARIVLWNAIKDGKVTKDLYPYFFKTCKNQCLKAVRKKGAHSETLIGTNDEDYQEGRINMEKVEYLLQSAADDDASQQYKSDMAHQALEMMTEKCRKLLWLYYNDELSWKVIADMTGLKNATTAKAAASRCRQTFREKYHS